MSHTVQTFPDKKMVIVSYEGVVTAEEAQKSFAAVAAFIDDIGGESIHRISDFTQATSTFADLMKLLQLAAKSNVPGGTLDKRITTIFVGTTEWARLYKDAMRQQQHGSGQVRMVTTLDDAMRLVEQDQQ